MLKEINDSMGSANSIDINIFPKGDIFLKNKDSVKNQLISGESDVSLFLDLSNLMIDSILTIDTIKWNYTINKRNIDTIAHWWNKNYRMLTPDLIEELLWYQKILQYTDFLYSLDEMFKLQQRLKSRIRFREKKENVTDSCLSERKKELMDQQKKLQAIFNNDQVIIDKIIPLGDTDFYIFLSKKLMYEKEYRLFTPISRYEFEDMMDWWYVNGYMVTDSIILSAITDYIFSISDY